MKLNNFKIELLILFTLLITITGCGSDIHTEYDSPIWKDSNTIYCIEKEHKKRFLLGSFIELGDEYEVYLSSMDIEGNNYQRIILLSDDNFEIYQVSSHESLFVYDKANEIWSVNLDGSNNKNIISGWYPRISPDGTKIAYLFSSSDYDVWVINIDGTENSKVWDDGKAYSVAWSTDSARIAISTTEGIRIVNVNTLESSLISNDGVTALDWSSDNKIYYSYYVIPGTTYELYKIDINGLNNTKISSIGRSYLRVSLDSNKIIVGGTSIAIMNSDGTNLNVIKEAITDF